MDLRFFYEDVNLRNAVKDFLIETLGEIAIDKTFNGEDVSGIKDARDLVERAFNKLEEEYGKIEKKVHISPR